MALLVLNLGVVANLGNINAIEKSFFLLSGIIYIIGKPFLRYSLISSIIVFSTIIICATLTQFYAFQWSRTLSATIALFAFVPFLLARPSYRERDLVLTSIAIFPVIFLLYSLLLNALVGLPLYFSDHTGANRLSGTLHPAFVAASCYAAALSSAFLFRQNRKFRYFFLCCISILLCLLSGTRMPSLCAAASCGLVLIGAIRGGASRLGLLVAGLILLAGFLLTVGDQILIRFMSGSTSGREGMWEVLNEWILRYPWAGVGFGHHGLLIPESVSKFTRTTAAHNEYLRSLVELGYIGSTVFLSGLFSLFALSTSRRVSGISFQSLILISILFVYASTDNVFFLSYSLFIPIVISWASSSAEDREIKSPS